MNDTILIKKDRIPYTFNIMLDNTGEYTFLVNYNETGRFFTIALYKDNQLISGAEPLRYGVTLFQDVFDVDTFPSINIVPFDYSNMTNEITYENFNKVVFLYIDDGASKEGDVL